MWRFSIPLAGLLLLSGCANSYFGALIFDSTMHPVSPQTFDEVYAAYPDSFVVVGRVQGTSSNTNLLGIVSTGNGGYQAAMENALSKADAVGLVNCVTDFRTTGFLGIISTRTTIVEGLAIRRKD